MSEEEQLERALQDCDTNIHNLINNLAACRDAIKEPQCEEVLRTLLRGREIMQKAIAGEYEKSRRLFSQLAILQGCDDV
jgi:hypothetical protein